MATRRTKSAPSAKPGRRARGGSGKTRIVVDFTDVDAGGGIPTPDGVYLAKVTKAEKEVSQAGNDMIVVRWKTNIGSTVFDRFVLVPQSLWVLRTAMQCMGFDTPDGEYGFDVEDLIGQECGIEINNELYEDKEQPRVTGYMPPEVAEGQIEAKPKKKTKAVEPDEEEDDDEEEDEAPPPRKASKRKKAAPPPDDDDDDDDGDEGEEEEEEAPPPPRKKKGAAAKKSGGALRAGARVLFADENGDDVQGVIEAIDGDTATVVDDTDGEWDIPLAELTKA